MAKKSLIEAVKKLLSKLGAEEVEGNDLVEVIDNGAETLAEAGGGGMFIVTIANEIDLTLNKTWQEIYNAAQTNEVVLIRVEQQKITQNRMEFIDNNKGYIVEFSGDVQFVAVTANDYPTHN